MDVQQYWGIPCHCTICEPCMKAVGKASRAGNVLWVEVGTSQSVPSTVFTMSWEGIDRMGTSQPVHFYCPCILGNHRKGQTEWEHCTTPFLRTMGRSGQSGNIPTSTTPHALIPTVHPIPTYHGKEWTEWEHPNLYHSPCPHPYCPSHQHSARSCSLSISKEKGTYIHM